MLALSRRLDESIVIGDETVQITVLDIRGNRVTLGINAPESVGVYRKEVWLRIQEEISTEDDELVDEVRESIDQANL